MVLLMVVVVVMAIKTVEDGDAVSRPQPREGLIQVIGCLIATF